MKSARASTSSQVVIGLVGSRGPLTGKEGEWYRTLVGYAAMRGFGLFAGGLNPESNAGSTVATGLLSEGWTIANGERLDSLKVLRMIVNQYSKRSASLLDAALEG